MKKVAVILGFYNPKNENLLLNAIQSLKKQTFKDFEIHIYDNSCIENSLQKVITKFPEVKIQKNMKNLGFAGGNNSVIRKLLKTDKYKYFVLLNDDTKPLANWLENLIKTADKNSNAGAVTSKLIFYEPYIRVNFKTQTFNPKELKTGKDIRDLGVKYFEDSGFINSKYKKVFLKSPGFYGYEMGEKEKFTWTKDKFTIDFPIGEEIKEKYVLNLKIQKTEHLKKQSLRIKLGDFEKELELQDKKNSYEIEFPTEVVIKNKFDLIQNAGSFVTAQFQGLDRGVSQSVSDVTLQPEIDNGQYSQTEEVEMFCGGAALLNVEVLKEVGIFDEYFFSYYEDSDLSLRIRRAGYKILFEPKAIVRHIHAGSGGEWSTFFVYHINKNRIAFVTKNFGIRPVLWVWKDVIRQTLLWFMIPGIKKRFKDKHLNHMSKLYVKIIINGIFNTPMHLLKKYKIIKSN